MLKNNKTLLFFLLRRDRFNILFWFLGIMVLVLGVGAGIYGMYPTAQDRATMAGTLASPAMLAMTGPIFASADGSYSLGAIFQAVMFVWTAMGMGIMNVFLVVRHTRGDEERGRIELIRSLPVGKVANLSATLSLAFLQNLIFALVMGLGLGVFGYESMDMPATLLFGLAMGTMGFIFAAITAVFCQLTSNPRTAQASSIAVLIILFFVRAVGDMQGIEALSMVSPYGLLQRTKVFVDNIWWPLLVGLLIAFVFMILAFALCTRRDLGEGLIAARKGKAKAAAYLSSAGGLAWRLLRTPIFIWLVVIFVLAAAYGSVMSDVESFMQGNELFQTIAGGDPMMLISMFILIACLCAAIPVLQFVLKVHSQESRGFAEGLMARAVSRNALLRGYVIIAFIAALLGPFVSALGFWVASTPVMQNPISLDRFLEACMLYVPALLFFLGLTVFLIGFIPKVVSWVWAYLGFSLLIVYFGGILNLPDWLKLTTPFGHIPMVPVDTVDKQALLVLGVICFIALILTILGFIGFRRRDLKY